MYVAIGLTILLIFASLLLKLATGEAAHLDFGQLYAAGAMISEGQTGYLYDLKAQTATQERVLRRPGVLPFISPPFEALLFVPMAKIPYSQAYLLWGAFNIALYVWFAWMTRIVSGLSIYQHLIACFGFFPLWLAVDLGQMTLVLLVLVTFSAFAVKREQDFRAGILLGLGLFRFQLLLPLLVFSLVQRRWRFLGGTALVGALYLALSLWIVGFGGLWSYLRLLNNITETLGDSSSWNMPTIQCFFNLFFSPRPVIVKSLSIISGLALLGWLIHRASKLDEDHCLAALLFVSVLLTPYAHPYDLSLVLLGFFLANHTLGARYWTMLLAYPLIAFVAGAFDERLRVLWPLIGVPLILLATALVLSEENRSYPWHKLFLFQTKIISHNE